jgi:hypothetical protein
MTTEPLKLIALDAEDLAVVSAHLQDAALTIGDLVYLPREHRFAFAADRFDWEASATEHCQRRRRTAVHFDGVKGVRSRGIPLDKRDIRLNLLAIAFQPKDAPGGAVMLHFSGGACVCLDVECLEAALKDLGPCWEIAGQAAHPPLEDA